MFAERASPSNWFGPTRWLPPPGAVEDLPEIDFVCISHNQYVLRIASFYIVLITMHMDSYDHLHLEALLILNSRSPSNRPINFFVPLGVKSLLVSSGIETGRVHELDWWTSMSFAIPIHAKAPVSSIPPSKFPSTSLSPLAAHSLSIASTTAAPASPTTESLPRITVTLTPTQHNSGRGILDQCTTLWGSWVVKQAWSSAQDESEGDDKRGEGRGKAGKEKEAIVWFAGDTGYKTSEGPCPIFKGQSLHWHVETLIVDNPLPKNIEIGSIYGPFDLAFIPIWRGASLSFIGRLGYRVRLFHSPVLISIE